MAFAAEFQASLADVNGGGATGASDSEDPT